MINGKILFMYEHAPNTNFFYFLACDIGDMVKNKINLSNRTTVTLNASGLFVFGMDDEGIEIFKDCHSFDHRYPITFNTCLIAPIINGCDSSYELNVDDNNRYLFALYAFPCKIEASVAKIVKKATRNSRIAKKFLSERLLSDEYKKLVNMVNFPQHFKQWKNG